MNQIPNIEEVVEQFMMMWFRSAYFEALIPINRQEQVIYDEAKLKWETCKQQLTETLHQQLQKARQEGYKLAVKHLKEAYAANGATTVPEAIEWLEDNSRYQAELN